MGTLARYRKLLEELLTEHTRVSFAHGDVQCETVFDRAADRYLVMLVGWEGIRRVHGCLIHVDIIDGKFWVQRDGSERGIARELLEAGIPREQIVLAFRSEEARQPTDLAVA
jgi:hypothetical protein